jgi:hypothetical protein
MQRIAHAQWGMGVVERVVSGRVSRCARARPRDADA